MRPLGSLKTIVLVAALICVLMLLMTTHDLRMALNDVSTVSTRELTTVDNRVNPQDWEKDLNFTGFDNVTGTADGHYIVPNYVHFLRFGKKKLSFVHMICLLAAFKHQKPDKLFVHTDADRLEGKYWDILWNTPGFKDVLVVEQTELPREIFGQKLNQAWANFHGADVARLLAMMKYGGIYLDNDSYIIRSLNDFRKYEMAIGWRVGKNMGNQVFVAHKDARFLKLWLDTYRQYKPKEWYYNAGVRPTVEVLNNQPHLVHRVPGNLLGVYSMVNKLYLEWWKDWREYYSVHLMARHQYMLNRNLSSVATFPVIFNETNIKLYPNTFRDMVQEVFDIGIKSNN